MKMSQEQLIQDMKNLVKEKKDLVEDLLQM